MANTELFLDRSPKRVQSSSMSRVRKPLYCDDREKPRVKSESLFSLQQALQTVIASLVSRPVESARAPVGAITSMVSHTMQGLITITFPGLSVHTHTLPQLPLLTVVSLTSLLFLLVLMVMCLYSLQSDHALDQLVCSGRLLAEASHDQTDDGSLL